MLNKQLCEHYRIPFKYQNVDNIEVYSTFNAMDFIYSSPRVTWKKLLFWIFYRQEKKPLAFGKLMHKNTLRLYVYRVGEKAGAKINKIADLSNKEEWFYTYDEIEEDEEVLNE